MKPTPRGRPRISSALFYDDAARAIDGLCAAFALEVKIRVEGESGRIERSEFAYGDGLVMVASPGRGGKAPRAKSPGQAGGNTRSLFVHVDDVEAHCARARAAGARITEEPRTNDDGEEHWTDRTRGSEDPGGHHWWFGERLRTGRR